LEAAVRSRIGSGRDEVRRRLPAQSDRALTHSNSLHALGAFKRTRMGRARQSR
jgi:hypothetical protein